MYGRDECGGQGVQSTPEAQSMQDGWEYGLHVIWVGPTRQISKPTWGEGHNKDTKIRLASLKSPYSVRLFSLHVTSRTQYCTQWVSNPFLTLPGAQLVSQFSFEKDEWWNQDRPVIILTAACLPLVQFERSVRADFKTINKASTSVLVPPRPAAPCNDILHANITIFYLFLPFQMFKWTPFS